MKNKKISEDFFKNAILKGNVKLLDEFTSSVVERKVGADVFFEIKKESEHHRINERITKFVLSHIPINSSACGFVQGKSYFDFLKPHITGYYFLRLDIKSFFHSIPANEVKLLLEKYFSNVKAEKKYSPLDIAISAILYKVSDIFSEKDLRGKEVLPIGFSSSPVISNILFRRVDILIQKYCEDKGIVYSRYADDLLFSAKKSKFVHTEQFEKEISIFISVLSLKLKGIKRKASENTLSLNGYVIQNVKPKKFFNIYIHKEDPVGAIRISNKKLKIIQKLAAGLNHGKSAVYIMENIFGIKFVQFKKTFGNNRMFYKKYAHDQLQSKLKGYRSYLISLIKFDERYECIDKNCLLKAKSLVKFFENHIE